MNGELKVFFWEVHRFHSFRFGIHGRCVFGVMRIRNSVEFRSAGNVFEIGMHILPVQSFYSRCCVESFIFDLAIDQISKCFWFEFEELEVK